VLIDPMRDWRTLLATPRFRALWIALVCGNLGSWSMLAALPILVAERFDAGSALVLALGWRILPKILLAPVAGILLRRFGAVRVACCAMVGEAALTVMLPWCEAFAWLQVLIVAIGALDVFMMPGLLALRGTVAPEGLELATNSLCSTADRFGKMMGPAIGGVAVLTGFAPAFLCFAIMIVAAAVMVTRLPEPILPASPRGSRMLALPKEFWRMLRGDRALVGLVTCAVTYTVMLGGLRPFLFWANREWFGAADNAWAGLITAQGLGAIIGAFAAGGFNRALSRSLSAYTLTMLTGFIEAVLHVLLLAVPNGDTGFRIAMVILAVAGVPEAISTAAWFTVLQRRLSIDRQLVFLAFTAPMWDCAFAVGLLSAGLHAGGALSLAPWWAILSLTATLPIVPLLLRDATRGSPRAAAT
jgi:MFS family permease